jgi:hypothetical protein
METIKAALAFLRRVAQGFGPYVLLELVLPGGTLFAVLLFLYRNGGLHPENVLPITWACAAAFSVPYMARREANATRCSVARVKA